MWRTSERQASKEHGLIFGGKTGQTRVTAVCSISQQITLPFLFVCERALKHSAFSRRQVCQSTRLVQIAWSFFSVPGGDRKGTACYLSHGDFTASLPWTCCRPAFACFTSAGFATAFWPHVVHRWLFLGEAAPVALAVSFPPVDKNG